jgi:hypothetical protein
MGLQIYHEWCVDKDLEGDTCDLSDDTIPAFAQSAWGKAQKLLSGYAVTGRQPHTSPEWRQSCTVKRRSVSLVLELMAHTVKPCTRVGRNKNRNCGVVGMKSKQAGCPSGCPATHDASTPPPPPQRLIFIRCSPSHQEESAPGLRGQHHSYCLIHPLVVCTVLPYFILCLTVMLKCQWGGIRSEVDHERLLHRCWKKEAVSGIWAFSWRDKPLCQDSR